MRHSRAQPQLPRALVRAFYHSDSQMGRAARELMARLLADRASREGARDALVAGLGDHVPQVRGTCALLLLESGEPAQPQLLRALVGTFSYPDSQMGRTARDLMAGLLADEASRETTRGALVTGLSDEVPSIRTTCDQLLRMVR